MRIHVFTFIMGKMEVRTLILSLSKQGIFLALSKAVTLLRVSHYCGCDVQCMHVKLKCLMMLLWAPDVVALWTLLLFLHCLLWMLRCCIIALLNHTTKLKTKKFSQYWISAPPPSHNFCTPLPFKTK